MEQLQVQPAALAEMIQLIEGGTISGAIAKQILPQLLQVNRKVASGAIMLVPRATTDAP